MATETGTASTMDIKQLMEVIPHRFPMLLVDRILHMVPGKSCVGVKNVTINEAFFQGHYPGEPVMPGVLIIEAMAQAGAALLLTEPQNKGRTPLIGSLDKVKFRRPVVPGDQLISTIELLWLRNGYGALKATATVDGQLVATMEMSFKLAESDR
jgi:beta-hydroxyacyl-ACP dehydratase FabZ